MILRRIEVLIAGLLFGGSLATIFCIWMDYDWSLSPQNIRLNPDIFMNQYLGIVLLLCTTACVYAGFRLFSMICSPSGANRNSAEPAN